MNFNEKQISKNNIKKTKHIKFEIEQSNHII